MSVLDSFLWQRNTALYGHPTHFIDPSVSDHSGCFHFLAIMNNAAVNIFVYISVDTCFTFSWVYTWLWNGWVILQLCLIALVCVAMVPLSSFKKLYMCGFISGVCILFYFFKFVDPMPVAHCLDYCDFKVNIEIR